MRKFLQVSTFIISITVFSQTLTDKIVQSAANNIKSEDYQTALTILSEADENDYRVSYMQIISRFSILKNLQDKTTAEASRYISKFGNKNASYSKSVSQILSNINNNNTTSNNITTVATDELEPLIVSPFVPIKYGSDVADFEWLGKKTKKLFTSPNYAIIINRKAISEFLFLYEKNKGMSFYKGKINFCHFYEINTENVDGTGQRKMLDLRNGQIYEVPSKSLKCANDKDQEFVNNSNVYIIHKCEEGKSIDYVYEWDENIKYFNLIKTKIN